MEDIKTNKAPQAIGPYSQAIKAHGFVFVSGQIGLDPKTNEFVKGGVEEQAEQVLKNIGEILKAAGADYRDVVKCEIFLTNISDFVKINELYGKYFFSTPKPARQTVEVSNLPKGALIEISCIASI